MVSLKKTIEKSLRENVPLSKIKRDLREGGYKSEDITKAVREVIAGIDNKSKTILPVLVVLSIILAVSIVYFAYSPTQQYADMCSKFTKVEGEVSCEEAIDIVTSKYAGKVQEIFQGSNYRPANTTQEGKDIWRIEIKLDNPVEQKGDILNGVGVFLDRKTGEELRSRYEKAI
ncbi:MAG: hypothetical protein HY361_02605 [Candidatus Aenigmarchaeota archaeon]|nr:hypothetical protein [Candidatus Aenigmarchaeota archaeon]